MVVAAKAADLSINSLIPANRSPLHGRVGEWFKPPDCKSGALRSNRRFESYCAHHLEQSKTRACG